eukprot:superscaffoldBa00000988_g8377
MMRSKSVENFFQRSYSDARLPPDFITDPPPPSPPMLPGSPLVGDRSPSISPSLSPNPSISSHSPSLSLSPSLPIKPSRPQITHCFQDHVFRKPNNCENCKHMIVGKETPNKLFGVKRARWPLTCGAPRNYRSSRVMGRSKVGHFGPGLTVLLQLYLDPPVPPDWHRHKQCNLKATRMRVDPVYAALRYGTSLAQMSRSSFGSLSESPTHNLEEGGEEMQQRQCSMEEEITQETGDTPVPDTEIEKEEDASSGQAQTPTEVPKRIEVHSIHTYVALYKFLPQEQNDLELQYSLCPRTFSKCVDMVLALLREKGARILTYIEDWLILAASRQEAESHTALITHVTQLGFSIYPTKSSLQPSQQMPYLGLQLDSCTMTAHLGATGVSSSLQANMGGAWLSSHCHINLQKVLHHFASQLSGNLIMGKSGDRVGFFPANFVQRVRPGERVWRVVQGASGNRDRGHMAVRESQICVGKREDGEVFLKLSSGKKRGLVPADSIEEI